MINAAELATYDQVKETLIDNKLLNDGLHTHFISSAIAGFTAVLVGSPADVLKSAIMDGKKTADGSKVPFKSIFEAIGHINGKSGFKGFYKGFNANCQRIISWNIVMFLTKEQVMLYLANSNQK